MPNEPSGSVFDRVERLRIEKEYGVPVTDELWARYEHLHRNLVATMGNYAEVYGHLDNLPKSARKENAALMVARAEAEWWDEQLMPQRELGTVVGRERPGTDEDHVPVLRDAEGNRFLMDSAGVRADSMGELQLKWGDNADAAEAANPPDPDDLF
jgi:hypothetical protein